MKAKGQCVGCWRGANCYNKDWPELVKWSKADLGNKREFQGVLLVLSKEQPKGFPDNMVASSIVTGMRVSLWYWFLTTLQFLSRFKNVPPSQLRPVVRIVEILSEERTRLKGVLIRPTDSLDDDGKEHSDMLVKGYRKVELFSEWRVDAQELHLTPDSEGRKSQANESMVYHLATHISSRAPDCLFRSVGVGFIL